MDYSQDTTSERLTAQPLPRTGFESDNFTERRTGGAESFGNAYDPESLLTGAESAAGLTYDDHRVWPSERLYRDAVAGRISVDDIPSIAPRQKGLARTSVHVSAELPIFRPGESAPLPVATAPNRLYTRGA